MSSGKVLSQTCVKINNTYFDITENSFKLKKGYGTKENVATIGAGGKITRNVVPQIGERFATGSFQILNTQENQDKIEELIKEIKSKTTTSENKQVLVKSIKELGKSKITELNFKELSEIINKLK